MARGVEIRTEVHVWTAEKVDRAVLMLAAVAFMRWRVALGKAGR